MTTRAATRARSASRVARRIYAMATVDELTKTDLVTAVLACPQCGETSLFNTNWHGPAHRASRERRTRQMAPPDERRSELRLLRKAQEQRSRSDRRGRRIHQRELPRHQRRSPDSLALHQPADPNARRAAATFAAGLWHGHSTVAEHT